MYKDILLPTDGAEGFENITEHALEIADKFDAAVHVVNVVDTRVMVHGVEMPHIMEELEQSAEETAEEIADKARERGIPVYTETPKGIPSKEILDYSDEKDVDLIVMGTHGRTGLERIAIGSVAEKVVRKAETPVMTAELEQSE